VADRLTVGVAARLSRYLQVLTQARKMGKTRISSQRSRSTRTSTRPRSGATSRRSASSQARVGYNIDSLLGEIRKILRTQGSTTSPWWAPAGSEQAIASSPIFGEHGINIAAVFDTDPEKIGLPIGHVAVSEYGGLSDAIRDKNILVGVSRCRRAPRSRPRTTSSAPGSRIIFNYSEALLETPADVTVHTSNPAVELLYALYFHLT